jgi:hypothetical protein
VQLVTGRTGQAITSHIAGTHFAFETQQTRGDDPDISRAFRNSQNFLFGIILLSHVLSLFKAGSPANHDVSFSFDFKKKIQLAAESLSFAPQESMVSQKGRLDASVFVSAHPDVAILLARMNTCNEDLSEIIKEYLAHSCGFGIGSLGSKWSMSEVSEFHEFFEGGIGLEAIDGLRLR